MANSPQALKRARQTQRRRQRTQPQTTYFRTVVKKMRAAAVSGENAKATFLSLQSVVDRAARKGLTHKNTAARLKKRLNALMRAHATENAGN